MKYLPYVTHATCLLSVLFSAAVFVKGEPLIEAISTEQLPALVFMQENNDAKSTERRSLMLATFDGGKAVVQRIMTSEHVEAVQLSDRVFLLKAAPFPPYQQACFLVNFRTGQRVRLSIGEPRDKLIHLRCLRSVPDKNQAMILQYGPETETESLLQVDLNTLQAVARYLLPRSDATQGIQGPRMKISPDFTSLAAMVAQQENKVQPPARQLAFSLRVFNLETMKTTELDAQIVVEISPVSSLPGGTPPFEWIGDQDILYQHMIPWEADDNNLRLHGQYVLKCVNIKSKKVTEWIRKQMPLTLDGGNLNHDWLTGELQYNDFIVDTRMRGLRPYCPCFSVKWDRSGTEISFHDDILYRQSGRRQPAQACASRNQEHIAYSLRLDDKGNSMLYAKIKGMKEVVEVSKAGFCTPLMWIEGDDERFQE